MNAATSTARQGPLSAGDQFLKFEIRRLLGQGGHGWVYHGYDPFLDRDVAIKVIPDPADRGRDLGRRAQLEARVLCKLQHRNVVHVIDAGATSEGAVYIVMELLQGRTLRDAIRDYRQLSVAEVLSLGAQVADGVQAAHEQSAIHRDLKPENVFVLEGNAVKVLDFGIAKFLGAGAATTQRDLLHGTVLYMSPEHLQGFRVTPRSDIYALGTTLYEALAGCPPCLIGMEEPTLESVTFAQINRMPTPLDALTRTVPRFVARAIQRMLAKEPSDRFSTMAEVSQVLRANLQRFVNEVPEGTASPRALSRGMHSISPASAIRSSQATTDAFELGPTTSPDLELRAARTRDTPTPLQFSPAPAVPSFHHSQEPRLPCPPIQPSQARFQPSASVPQFETKSLHRQAAPMLGPAAAVTLPQLLLSAVALGAVVGLAVGLIRNLPPAQPVTSRSSQSSARRTPVPGAPESTASAREPIIPRAVPSSPAASATSASAPATSASARALTALSASHPSPAAKVAHKPANSGPASGLVEAPAMTPKKVELVTPATSSSARRHPKAIYGSDDGAE